MRCAWDALLAILPPWIRSEVDKLGKLELLELRLCLNQFPQLVFAKERRELNRKVSMDDLNFCINTASRYSPWAANTMAQGYISALGGHRIGLCGEAVCKAGADEKHVQFVIRTGIFPKHLGRGLIFLGFLILFVRFLGSGSILGAL